MHNVKRRRHTPEQIIRKLREADRLLAEGKTVEEVARHLEISEQTYHRWRAQYGPNRRRAAVMMLRERFGVSERRACKVVGQHRSTQRLDEPVPDDEEQRLRAWLREFSTRRPRWG